MAGPTFHLRFHPSTIFARLAYALVGPSRVLVPRPASSLVALVIGVVPPLSAGDPQRAMALAGMRAEIWLFRRSRRLPGALIAVSGATVIVAALDHAARSGVQVLDSLPQGLPSFVFPSITAADLVPALLGGMAVALVSFADTSRIYRIQRWEFWLLMGCLAGVAILGPIPGIGLFIVIAVVEFLWDGWRPHFAVLGRVDGVKGYHDIQRYPHARIVPGLVLLRWDAPPFFANAELFRDRVLDAVAASATPVRWLVVGAEPITGAEITAADTLDELDAVLHAAGIDLCFAEMKDPAKDKLKRFGLFTRLGEARFFATIGEAVSCCLEAHLVEWVDWEDRRQAHWREKAARSGDARTRPSPGGAQ